MYNMVGNPFKYGVVVTGDDFVDRERELNELKRDLLSKKSVILYSQRALGKSSLAEELFKRLGRGAICARINMYGMESRESLAEEIVRCITTSAYTSFDKMRIAVAEFLKGIKLDIVLTPDGEVRFELGKSTTSKELAEILDFAENVAKKKGKPMIVAFDEFQEIGILDGVELEKLMRSKFQYHRNVSYLFMGSKRHLLQEIFSEESRAFYKFGKPMSLGFIPKEEFAAFISRKFEESGGSISEDAIECALNVTEGHPYYTQQLCYGMWFISKNVKDASLVEKAMREILAHEQVNYLKIWDGLSIPQRRLLTGLAREEHPNVYSADFIDEYTLKTPSRVQRALESLESKGIIDENKITDIFFREWLKREKS